MKKLVWLFVFFALVSSVYACTDGEVRDCGENIGVCKAGMQMCEGGVWSICYGGSYAAAQLESCNGLDDDCDGTIDENCECFGGETQDCSSNVGICKQGVQNCVNGSWGACEGGVEAGIEICGNLLDDDCDGMVDYEDDNCASQKVVVEEVEEVECYDDRDCEEGYECDRNSCFEIKEPEVEVKTETSENASKTSGLSSTETEEETNYMSFLIPIVIVVLVLLLVLLIVMQKKKKIPTTRIANTKNSFKPFIFSSENKNNQIKSKLEKDLENSFNTSKEIFKK